MGWACGFHAKQVLASKESHSGESNVLEKQQLSIYHWRTKAVDTQRAMRRLNGSKTPGSPVLLALLHVNECPSTLSIVSFFLPSKRKRSSPFLMLFCMSRRTQLANLPRTTSTRPRTQLRELPSFHVQCVPAVLTQDTSRVRTPISSWITLQFQDFQRPSGENDSAPHLAKSATWTDLNSLRTPQNTLATKLLLLHLLLKVAIHTQWEHPYSLRKGKLQEEASNKVNSRIFCSVEKA